MNVKNVLVAGASGALGIEILKLLSTEDLYVRALIRSKESVKETEGLSKDVWQADASKDPDLIKGITQGGYHRNLCSGGEFKYVCAVKGYVL